MRKFGAKYKFYNIKFKEREKYVPSKENITKTISPISHHKFNLKLYVKCKANRKTLKIIYHSFNDIIKLRNKNHSKKNLIVAIQRPRFHLMCMVSPVKPALKIQRISMS